MNASSLLQRAEQLLTAEAWSSGRATESPCHRSMEQPPYVPSPLQGEARERVEEPESFSVAQLGFFYDERIT